MAINLEDSSTYRAIFRKGEIDGVQTHILKFSGAKLGAPSPEVESMVRGIQDYDRLFRIDDRQFEATSWPDLLATP